MKMKKKTAEEFNSISHKNGFPVGSLYYKCWCVFQKSNKVLLACFSPCTLSKSEKEIR